MIGAALAVLALAGGAPAPAAAQEVFEGPVPRAQCGPGSAPESPGTLQGEVPAADRDSGRSLQPYTCNLELIGNDPGGGASWQQTWHGDCAYYDTRFQSGLGTQIIDVTDPAKPRTAGALTSPAMLDPWESLSVNQTRGLLAGITAWNGNGPLFFDVYDVGKDCKAPELKSSAPINGIGHEGDWAPDGRTYYTTSTRPGTLTAIDVTDPAAPRRLSTIPVPLVVHGLSVSDDGNRLYLANIQNEETTTGMTVVDVSAVNARAPGGQMRVVSRIGWTDGRTGQHTIPISVKGRPYVVHVDELGNGATRIIDITDETRPRIVSKLKLEIQMPEHADRAAETGSDNLFGYNTHYCGIDRRTDPTVLGCSHFQSGVRIFDIRDPLAPREIAYFNPGGTGSAPPAGSNDNAPRVTSGYPSSRVRFIPERAEIWFTDQNKGFHVARFTNGTWPFPARAGAPVPAPVGLPRPARCLRRASVRFRLRPALRRRARSAVITVGGRRVRRLGRAAVRRPIRVRLPRGRSVVRVVVRTRSGGRVVQTRDYTRCS